MKSAMFRALRFVLGYVMPVGALYVASIFVVICSELYRTQQLNNHVGVGCVFVCLLCIFIAKNQFNEVQ